MTTAAAAPAPTKPDAEPSRVVVLFESYEADALDALVDRLNAQARDRREARRHNRSTVIREAVAALDAATRSPKPAAKPQP